MSFAAATGRHSREHPPQPTEVSHDRDRHADRPRSGWPDSSRASPTISSASPLPVPTTPSAICSTTSTRSRSRSSRRRTRHVTPVRCRLAVARPGWATTGAPASRSQLATMADAWRDPEAWTGMTVIGGGETPGEVCGLIGLDELIVHGWDVARATGQEFESDDESLDACRNVLSMFAVPGKVVDPGGPFGTVVDVPADARRCSIEVPRAERPQPGVRTRPSRFRELAGRDAATGSALRRRPRSRPGCARTARCAGRRRSPRSSRRARSARATSPS